VVGQKHQGVDLAQLLARQSNNSHRLMHAEEVALRQDIEYRKMTQYLDNLRKEVADIKERVGRLDGAKDGED
jgi:hypothetical protein